MPSLIEKVLELIDGVSDMALRDGVLQSVLFLRDVYRDGRASDEQVLGDLREICQTVLGGKHMDWDVSQIREEADVRASELLRYMSIEVMASRLRGKYSPPPSY